MTTEIKTPSLPESVADATVLAWLKQPGESCTRDEVLAELETDKVTLTVHAPTDGTIVEIIHDEGATVGSGDVLGTFAEGAAAEPAAAAPAAVAEAPSGADAPLSPAVRVLLEEHGLNAADVSASGKDGRLVKGDILAHLEKQPAASAPAQAAPSAVQAPTPAPAPSKPLSVSIPQGRVEERVPMTRLRKRVAERLKEAQNTAAMLTTYNEVDLQAVKRLRAEYADKFEEEHGVRLGFMSFVVKACIEALKKYPAVNAAIDGDDVIYHGYFDVGIAVSAPKGLVVPILRDADLMTFADIEKSIAEYGAKAKEGTLTVEEMTGGTFSVTNAACLGR